MQLLFTTANTNYAEKGFKTFLHSSDNNLLQQRRVLVGVQYLFPVYTECVGSTLTGLYPGGWVSCDRSVPEQGPGDCVPIWSWPRYWPRSEPSETYTQQ